MSEQTPEAPTDIAQDQAPDPSETAYTALVDKFKAESKSASTPDQHTLTIAVPELGEVEVNDYMDHEHTSESHMQAGKKVLLQRPILTINLPKGPEGEINSYIVFRAGDLDIEGIMGTYFAQHLGESAFANPDHILFVRWEGKNRFLADPAQDTVLKQILDAIGK